MEKLTVEYRGIAEGGMKLGTTMPSQLAEEANSALSKLGEALGEDVSGFVAKRLDFTRDELFRALAVEQIDGVAMAVYNIEARSQAVIIGDQTGLGKGRQAAAMVRYGLLAGYLPVFFTDRYTLFSDMYRDCKALGIQQARPLIVNSGVSVVDFDKIVEPEQTGDAPDEIWAPASDDENEVDEQELLSVYERQYEIVYRSLRKREMQLLYEKGDIPENSFDYLMITYSQLKDARRDRTRLDFLKSLCRKHRLLFIFDEAHRSSSVTAGNASVITQCINSILEDSSEAQCVFLSATFAKRPECLVTFMQRTALSSLATQSTLRKAFASGGVPMQEYVSTMLASEGQMLRREQSNEGIPDPVYTYLDDLLPVHTALFDRVMYWFRELVSLSSLVSEAVSVGKLHDVEELEEWNCYPTRAQLFYVNKVLLLALKAKKIADVAVGEVRAGRSVVIGMSDTLECVLQDVVKKEDGSCRGDFSAILLRLLEKTVRNTKTGADLLSLEFGQQSDLAEVDEALSKVRDYYNMIKLGIRNETFHLPVSPIDVIRQLITEEKFETPDGRFINIRFEECTGRAHRLEYACPDGQDDFCLATLIPRKKVHSNHIFNDFQNNKLDVILINACGATGASAHAIATAEVPDDQVRQRKMLIVQNDLDVNIDLQKRGRINRTGQRADLPPLYEYIITAIPSEKRLNMMLRAKLRSLSANTTANQDQDRAQADFTDITNKYGNQVAREFLTAHEELAFLLGLKANSSLTASRLMARLAMLSVAAQQDAVEELFTAYKIYETDLRRINQWDLEREHRDFEAEFVREELFTASFDETRLGGCSYLTTYRCRHRTFPYDSKAVRMAVREAVERFGESFNGNKPLHKEIDAYYRQRRKRVKDRTAERINILKTNALESLGKVIGDDKLAGELVETAQCSFQEWSDKAYRMLEGMTKKNIILRRLKSFSNEFIATNDRMEQNLRKIAEEAKRLRLVLAHAVLGMVYDMTGYIETEIACDRVYAVLKNVRFGKDAARKFLPGQVEFVFALSAGFREIAINMVHTKRNSNYEKLHDILVSSRPSRFNDRKWDKEIARFNNQIIERKIITGNILGAFCHPAVEALRPRFITFTLAPDENGNKKIVRGLLLPLDETKLRETLQTVTLPLAEGLRYANSTSTAYQITGLEVRMTLLPVRSNVSGGLTFSFHVGEKSSNIFEDKAFDDIRDLFKCETVSSQMVEKDGTIRNLKRGRGRKKYYTDDLDFDSETMQTILNFLVRSRAMIVVPRSQITIGVMKQLDSRSQHNEDKPWKVLDWRHETARPLPPSRQYALRHITPPMAGDFKPGRLVDAFSPFVALCKDTVDIEGQDISLLSVRTRLKALYFRWREIPDDTAARYYLRNGMVGELYDILRWTGGKIKFSSHDFLEREARSEQLNDVAIIKERFEREMLFMAPPKEEVESFLDQCLCSPELEHIITALRKYLKGESDVIIA